MEQIKGTVNRVELVGWVGAEPEQRFIPSGARSATSGLRPSAGGAE